MTPLAGWDYWIQHEEKVRKFTVAEPDESKARSIVFARLPDAKFLSRTPLGSEVIKFLHMRPGAAAEWICIDGGEVDPKFGVVKMAG